MIVWHLYRLVDGGILGRTFSTISADRGDPQVSAVLEANTPAGHGVVTGVVDWESQRVDLSTGAVVDWQPPRPADEAMRTWTWNEQARRWLPVPTLAALRAARVSEAQAAIVGAEAAQARPARELALAAALGQPAPAAALVRLQRLDDSVNALRGLLAQLGAATSADELAALPSARQVTQG